MQSTHAIAQSATVELQDYLDNVLEPAGAVDSFREE